MNTCNWQFRLLVEIKQKQSVGTRASLKGRIYRVLLTTVKVLVFFTSVNKDQMLIFSLILITHEIPFKK